MVDKTMTLSIRPMSVEDTERVLEIWLDASILAHDFIAATYWRSNLSAMRDIYLPHAQTSVLYKKSLDHSSESIKGFISMVEERIAALFVDPHCWGSGYGSQLLAQAKELHPKLTLSVYKNNKRAVTFYRKHGFVVENEINDESTGQPEFSMRWKPLM